MDWEQHYSKWSLSMARQTSSMGTHDNPTPSKITLDELKKVFPVKEWHSFHFSGTKRVYIAPWLRNIFGTAWEMWDTIIPWYSQKKSRFSLKKIIGTFTVNSCINFESDVLMQVELISIWTWFLSFYLDMILWHWKLLTFGGNIICKQILVQM
jgi:hypothetical protein